MPGSFFDTNVIAYLASNNAAKADRAEQLVGKGGVISVQVLNELSNVARRKMRLPWSDTFQLLQVVRDLLDVVPVTTQIHETGLGLSQRYNLPIYDAMIAAAALTSDCDVLWSEDFQDNMLLDGRLRVTNPFAEA